MPHGDCINNFPDSVNTNSQVLVRFPSSYFIQHKKAKHYSLLKVLTEINLEKNIQSDVTQEFTQYTGMLVCLHVFL